MKQMLRSQKIRTLVPLFLALLLRFLAVPFSVAAEGEGSATAYPDELLSEFATFDAADKVAGNHTASNRTDFESKAPNKSVVRGADDKTALLAADDASKTTGGLLLNTGLPFSTASAVAVEFYLKVSNVIPDSTNLYFGIMTSNSGDAPTSRASVGFTLRGDGTRVVYLDGWNIRSADCSEYLWNTDVNRDDGYTRFVMTYNNGDVKVYCGDSSVVLLSHNYSSQEWKEPFNAQLYLTVGVHGKAEDTTDSSFNLSQIKGKTVANLKDISVYSGALTPTEIDALYQKITPAVRFEKNGRLLDIRKPVNGTLTVDSFPNIESDQTVCWFNKETGALVQAGTIFDRDTTLVAREYDSNESILLVAQNTTPTDGKAAARFVGGVWDLTGDHVGFDIQVTYTKGSQEVTEKYRKMGSAVYTSVLAAGERRTANELGVMYLFALSFEEIPAQGTITFKLKPFKSSGDKRIYGKGGTFTMTDGEFTEPPSVDEKDFTREDWKLSGVPAYPKGSNTLNADTYACGTTIKNYSQNGHNDTGSVHGSAHQLERVFSLYGKARTLRLSQGVRK